MSAEYADIEAFSPLPDIQGDYLKFTFAESNLREYEKNAVAYWSVISANNIKRREGYDVEQFSSVLTDEGVSYYYTLYIPVVFDDNLLNTLLRLQGDNQE
jgi:hypothetical protein